MTVAGRQLLINVTEDWYFCSHRLPLAQAARAAGYEVSVVTRVRDLGDFIRQHDLKLIPFENARTGMNPFAELSALVRMIKVYRRERPDVVHHVAMKPVLYGTIAARFGGRPVVINALAGMGWLFTSGGGLARLLKPLVRTWLRHALKSGIALVQNPDDARLLVKAGVPERNIRIIRGSGVDLDRFMPTPEPEGIPVVVLPARLLWDKGVGEFVQASRILRERGVAATFVLAGDPDAMNPAAIPMEKVQEWVREDLVRHAGWVEDMPSMLAASHVVCLPSYREGLPKSLIEAAAAGRPIVTTDVPGCREVVTDGYNGFLVPPRSPSALADALARLIGDRELRRKMGERGRERAVTEFGLRGVVERTLSIYEESASA